jgi:hypothetical protein
MSDEGLGQVVEPCGARFFDKVKRDLGRAVRVTKLVRSNSTLAAFDVTGAEPELARALSLLDRSVLRIHCEDGERNCYVFRWASGYGDGSNVRIQGVLEPRTGRELEGWSPLAKPTPPAARPDAGQAPSWGKPRRPW